MIFDTVEHAALYQGISKNLDLAIETMLNTDFSRIEPGEYEVDGRNVYFQVQETSLRDRNEARFEHHKTYVDIQMNIKDGEKVSCFPVQEIGQWGTYDDEGDISFSDTNAEGVDFLLNPGSFVVFFPQDAHIPCLKDKFGGATKKVVIKARL